MNDKTTPATFTTNPDLLSRTQLIAELRALRAVLETLRACEDLRCSICNTCVTALFITARPRPLRIPKKHTNHPWRKP